MTIGKDSVIKAVLFDLDGTLLDSLTGIAESLNRSLEDLGLSRLAVATIRTYVGDGSWMLVRRALDADQYSDEQVTAVEKSFQNHYAEVWKDGTVMFDGIKELLESLSERQVILGVLSNKVHHFVIEMVEAHFPVDLFDVVLGQCEGIPKKPDPTAGREISELFGLSPEQIVYVGDSTVDLEFAQNSGFKGLGVTWGYHDKEALSAHNMSLCDDVLKLGACLHGLCSDECNL